MKLEEQIEIVKELLEATKIVNFQVKDLKY